MFRRASRSWPFWVARSMWVQPRVKPSSAMPSAGGGQAWGQPQGQGGVEQGRFGHQVPTVKAEFAAIVHDHDRAAGHFTAGASRGRHRDQRGDAFADARRAAFDGGVIFQGPGVGGGNGHAFGAVDGRSTAKSHQAITSVLLIKRCGGAHRRLGRVGRGLVKHHRVAPQDLQGHDEQACGFDPGIGDDQGLLYMGFVALGFELLQSAIGNLDVGEVNDLGHGGCEGGGMGCGDQMPRARWSATIANGACHKLPTFPKRRGLAPGKRA